MNGVHGVDAVDTIPEDIVARSVRPELHSDFTRFLSGIFDPMIVEGLIGEYRLGVTRSRDVIFYQIDTQGRCRTGKVMKYDPDTGHRVKDENTPNRITWVHSLMKRSGQLSESWKLTQCLFGEHLLNEYPDKPVAIVEAEKTVVICAGLIPKFLWLATGGKSCLNFRLGILKGRSVIAFPDIDGYDVWCRKAAELNSTSSVMPGATGHLSITVSDILQRYGTDADRAAHIDIADWLIRWSQCHSERSEESASSYRHSWLDRESPVPSQSGTELPLYANPVVQEVAKYLPLEEMPEVAALIEDLGLELVRVERIEE